MNDEVAKQIGSILHGVWELNAHLNRGNEAKTLDSIESILKRLLQEIVDERKAAFQRHLDDMGHKREVETLLRDLVQR